MTNLRNVLFPAALSLAAFSLPAFSQEIPLEGPVPTTALINVHSKDDVPFNTAALKLEVDGRAASIASITPVGAGGTQVAVLIDDGLRSGFGIQLQDVKKFINALPAGTQVLLGYMQNGTVRSAGGFSTNHAAVADSVRVPFSTPGISASPYFCLSEFVKHWPGQGSAARMVLMITNGVDPYNGSVSPLNQDSPYVQAAQNDAQRAGVAVYSIYYGDSGIRGGLANFSGQSYLNQVAEATGGESFYQGRITPPSLTPYFNEFLKDIGESFIVNFNAVANHEKSSTLVRIKLKSEQKGVKIHAPDGVHPGLAE